MTVVIKEARICAICNFFSTHPFKWNQVSQRLYRRQSWLALCSTHITPCRLSRFSWSASNNFRSALPVMWWMQAIIPHHWLHPRNRRAFVCLSSNIWLKKPLGGVAVAAYLHNDEIPLIHLYHLSVVMCMLWRSDAGGTSICSLESWWIVIKNIVFSFFQPGTMIEWGNYW